MIDSQDILHELNRLPTTNIMLSKEGGILCRVINATGSTSQKGRLVKAKVGGSDDEVEFTGASDDECIGVEYETGIPDGGYMWIAICGIVDVLLDDNTAGTIGYWVETGAAGYADATNAAPVPETHWQEIGHVLRSVSAAGAGTHVLCRIMMHFN